MSEMSAEEINAWNMAAAGSMRRQWQGWLAEALAEKIDREALSGLINKYEVSNV